METMARKASTLTILAATVAIPLGSFHGWQDLKYSRIAPNNVRFGLEGVKIAVDHSSSPLIYPLTPPQTVTGFTADLEIAGTLKAQNSSWPEDCYLRIGFVVPGTRKLGMVEKFFVPDWITQLFRLAPEDSGVDKIYFFNLVKGGGGLGSTRMMPKSHDLIEERLAHTWPAGEKKATWKMELPRPLMVAALWLNADGDDSGSQFQVLIRKLELATTPKPDPEKPAALKN